jgi:hypothetical protein
MRLQAGMVWVAFQVLEGRLHRVEPFRFAPREFLSATRKLGRPDQLHVPRSSRMRSVAEPRVTLPRR